VQRSCAYLSRAAFVSKDRAAMTTLTMRYIKGDFVVTGPDIEPTKFKTRREAKE